MDQKDRQAPPAHQKASPPVTAPAATSPAATSPAATFRAESPRYRMRMLTPEDASERWASWTRSDDTAALVNGRPGGMSVAQLRALAGSRDSRTLQCLGWFDRVSGEHLGFCIVRINPAHAVAIIDLAIVAPEVRRRGAYQEAFVMLVDYLFRSLRMEKLLAMVLASNRRMIRNFETSGWICEGHFRKHYRTPDGSRVDALQYSLLPEDWPALRKRVIGRLKATLGRRR